MESYKQAFIEFMVQVGVLRFGDFTTKSGRKTPFFINTGLYRTGAQLRTLARFYADAIELQPNLSFNVLFGPAYKGIPLAVAIAMILAERGRPDVGFCFNRKESKDHGEGGLLVGHSLTDGDRVLIVEDVTTAGTSVRESVPLLQSAAKVTLAGLVVSVDRMERGAGTLNALAELGQEFKMPSFSIVNIEEIMEYLKGRALDGRILLTDDLYAQMRAYRERYGGG